MSLFFIIAVTLGFSFSAQAQDTTSPIANSAIVLLQELKYAQTKTIGLQVTTQEDESFLQTRLQSQDLQIVDANFECHVDHCHAVDQKNRTDITLTAATFENDALISSLNQALDIFSRKVASPMQIKSLKIWQTSDEIYVILSQEASAAYFMCHVHSGDHFDCHRSRAAGPQEPQW